MCTDLSFREILIYYFEKFFCMIGKTDQCCLLVNYLMVFRKEFVWHRYLPVQGHQARLARNFLLQFLVKQSNFDIQKQWGNYDDDDDNDLGVDNNHEQLC